MNGIKLPIGSSSFEYIRENHLYYIDKTSIIREVMNDGAQSILFTRPRRFGKTTLLTTLLSFFDITKDSRKLFEGLSIMEDRRFIDEWMNKIPVIYLSLREIDGDSFETAFGMLQKEIGKIFKKYHFLLDDEIFQDDEESFRRLMTASSTEIDIRSSMALLSRLLRNHYRKPVLFLVDEYDVPLDKAYSNGYYDQMLKIIRAIFYSILKDNNDLAKGILTGCLRISKESIFTGLNNLAVYSMTEPKYADAFGFTEKEVNRFLRDTDLAEAGPVMKKWYDGYRIGTESLYTPWDVISYANTLLADKSSSPRNYWANSSDNGVITRMIAETGASITDEYSALIDGREIPVHITENLTYDDLYSSKDNIWSLMFESGYLTLAGEYSSDSQTMVRIPNEEIRQLFATKVKEWFSADIKNKDMTKLFTAIWTKDAETVSKIISDFMFRTISYYDYSEAYYHAFIAGILSASSATTGYLVSSNEESGTGRPDIILMDPENRTAAIFEFKRSLSKNEMQATADIAINQIKEKKYGLDLPGYRKVIGYGIALFQKDAFAETVNIL